MAQAAFELAAPGHPESESSTTGVPAVGSQIGPYKLLEKIGEGGLGVVYMAERKESIRLRVAIKLIKPGMDSREVIARFEAERQALALMDHPNIAKIFDAGATEGGHPYFAMELVRGMRITEYCDRHNLSTRERLDLFITVAHAVQHAHQKGIIHRDLKPSNILVTINDGVAFPKIIDFGIAKATQQPLTEKTVFTRFNQLLGTPAYMSPEQAELTSFDIDTRTDIYSLGVLLYELLTSRTPFDPHELFKAGLEHMLRIIREIEPARPSACLTTLSGVELTTVAQQRHTEPPKLIKLVRGDLDWIVMKCLEKDRTRRYDTAGGLLADVNRHLGQEPVLARQPTALYRAQKFVRRNRVLVTAAALISLTWIFGISMSLWQWRNALDARNYGDEKAQAETSARQQADEHRLEAQARAAAETLAREEAVQQRALAGDLSTKLLLRQAEALFDADNPAAALAYLAAMLRDNPSNRFVAHQIVYGLAYRSFALPNRAIRMEHAAVARFSPDGRYIIASGTTNGAFAIWDAFSGNPVVKQQVLEGPVLLDSVQLTSDHDHIITSGPVRDNPSKASHIIGVWERHTGKPITRPIPFSRALCPAPVSPNGQRLLTVVSTNAPQLWSVATGQLINELRSSSSDPPVFSANFSPNSERVLVAYSNSARLWDATTGKAVSDIIFHTNEILRSVQFSVNGEYLFAAWSDFVQVWSANSGVANTNPFNVVPPDRGGLRHRKNWPVQTEGAANVFPFAAFSPDAKLFAAVLDGAEDLLRVFNVATGKQLTEIQTQAGAVQIARFHPLGGIILTVSSDSVRLWDARIGHALTEPLKHPAVDWAQFNPPGYHVLTASRRNKTARLWNARSGELLLSSISVDWQVGAPEFSRDGRHLLVHPGPGASVLIDVANGRVIDDPLKRREGFARFSPNGQCFLTFRDDTARVWDCDSGDPVTEPIRTGGIITSAAFNPEGTRIVTASRRPADGIRVWDIRSCQTRVRTLSSQPVTDLRFAEKSPLIVTAGGGLMTAWNVRTGERVSLGFQAYLPVKPFQRIQFSPHGQYAFVAWMQSNSWLCQTFDLNTRRPVVEPVSLPVREKFEDLPGVRDLRFSPDGRFVFTLRGLDNERRTNGFVWKVEVPTAPPIVFPHDGPVYEAQFSSDARRLATISGDPRSLLPVCRLWDVGSATLIAALGHEDRVNSLEFSADGKQLITASDDGTARRWDTETGRPTGDVLRHKRPVQFAGFSQDASRVATVTRDQCIQIWDASTGQALTGLLRSCPDGNPSSAGLQPIHSYWSIHVPRQSTPKWDVNLLPTVQFSPDQQWVAMNCLQGSVQGLFLWELPDPPLPVPQWVPDMAEVIGGQRLNAQRVLEVVGDDKLQTVRKRLVGISRDSFYARWARALLPQSDAHTNTPSFLDL